MEVFDKFNFMCFRSKFQCLSSHDIMLSEVLTSDPIHSELLEMISKNSVLKDKILQRSTTLQVRSADVILQCKKKCCKNASKGLCVCCNILSESKDLLDSSFRSFISTRRFFQVTLLEDVRRPDRKILIANTHLYWHPKGKKH